MLDATTCAALLAVQREAAGAWPLVRKLLCAKVDPEAFEAFLSRMHCTAEGHDTVRLSVPTSFLRAHVGHHYGDLIAWAWREVVGHEVTIHLVARGVVDPRPAPPLVPAPEPAEAPTGAGPDIRGRAPRLVVVDEARPQIGREPDARFALDRMLEGEGNALALAAVRQMCGDEHPPWSAVAIEGPTGYGKTHLLHAAAHALGARVLKPDHLALAAPPTRQALLAQAEAGPLLVDDIHLLGVRQGPALLGDLLDAAMGAGRPVIVATERPLNCLDGFPDRVAGRLSAMLRVTLEPWGDALRARYLDRQLSEMAAAGCAPSLSSAARNMLASSVLSPRALDGVLAHLSLCRAVTGAEMDDLVREDVRRLVALVAPRAVTTEAVLRAVTAHYGVSRADLLSQRRTRNVVMPRQIAMYLAKTLTLRSLPEIGLRFGGRDHTTVLHAVRKIGDLIEVDAALAQDVDTLSAAILGQGRAA